MKRRVSLTRLQVLELMAFAAELQARIDKLADSSIQSVRVYMRLAELIRQFSVSLLRPQRSLINPNKEDYARDRAFKYLKKRVVASTYSADSDEVYHAQRLQEAIVSIGPFLYRNNRFTESYDIIRLIELLESDKYAVSVDFLNLRPGIESLRKANEAFQREMDLRFDDIHKFLNVPTATAARQELEYSIREMMSYAEAQVMLNDSEQWQEICQYIDHMNEREISKLKRRRTFRIKREEAEDAPELPENSSEEALPEDEAGSR